ncbi:MAG: hypothetical protein RSC69_07270, partial [Lachnospiraceae bacterium]
MSFSYAASGSGPSAGGIGWFNFGNITLNPGDTLTNLTGTLNDVYCHATRAPFGSENFCART